MNVDSRSPLAEAYRHLRTSVLLSTAGRAPKSLLVTSSLPGEGKTTTAVNTAISLAQTGASVVIIDADMRRPRCKQSSTCVDRKDSARSFRATFPKTTCWRWSAR
jgi:Mrp family chromosome partitioning ATPase